MNACHSHRSAHGRRFRNGRNGRALEQIAEKPRSGVTLLASQDLLSERERHTVATTRRCPWRRDRGAGFTVISTSRPSTVRKYISRSVEKPDS